MSRFLLILVCVGCVPKGKFELAQVQLEATRTALQSREVGARNAIDAARSLSTELARDLEAADLRLGASQERIIELEAEVAQQAQRQAAALFEGIEACPPLVDPPPCPDCEGTPVERPVPEPEPPEVTEKRRMVQASLEEVSDALEASANASAAHAEVERQHGLVLAAFEGVVSDGYAEVLQSDRGTVVRVLTAKLYNENRASLSPLGEELIVKLAKGLNDLPGHKLTIIGHTDDQPVSSVAYPSTWELGFAYAVGVLRGLEYEGIPMQPAVTSRAGLSPARDEKTAEARRLNRRVELLLTPNPDLYQRELADAEPVPEETERGPTPEREVIPSPQETPTPGDSPSPEDALSPEQAPAPEEAPSPEDVPSPEASPEDPAP